MKIPILHLEDGIHVFEETLDSDPLHYYRREVYPYPLKVRVDLNKYETTVTCDIHIETVGKYSCDRCLEEYERPFEGELHLLFHLGKDTWNTSEENVVHLPPETVEVDLTPWITEQLSLSVPMKMLCRENCQGFCPGCGADLNHESCRCEKEGTDPRWDQLRKLLK